MRVSCCAGPFLVVLIAAGCSSPEVVETTSEPEPKTFTTTLQGEVRSTLPTAPAPTTTLSDTGESTLPTSAEDSFIADLDIFCGMFAARIDRIDAFLAAEADIFDPSKFEAFAADHVSALKEMRPYVPAEISHEYEISVAESQSDFEGFQKHEFDVVDMFLDQSDMPFSTAADHRMDDFVETECGIELPSSATAIDDSGASAQRGSTEASVGDAEALAALLESESGRLAVAAEMASELEITIEAATCFIDNVDIAKLSQPTSGDELDVAGFAEILEGLVACDVSLSSLGPFGDAE